MTKKLSRSIPNKMLGGVCSGMADYFDLDVSLVRLIFVAIDLVTGLIPMLIFYVIAWIVIPAGVPVSPQPEPKP
jgi:phage shock protein C